jgi:putative redox protein
MAQEVKQIALEWQEALRFHGGETGKPGVLIDGDNEQAPGPMLTLLIAAASCTGSDIVIVLRKMRVELEALHIDVAGTGREDEPLRYMAIPLNSLSL